MFPMFLYRNIERMAVEIANRTRTKQSNAENSFKFSTRRYFTQSRYNNSNLRESFVISSIKDRMFNDARSFVPRRMLRASREIFSARIEQRSVYTSRSRAVDDKEKCCLESRSWLNLGHPDDGACTFSTILLFLLSALPRVRSPPRIRRNNTFSLSLSLFPSIYLAHILASASPLLSFSLSIPLPFSSTSLRVRLFSSIDRLLLSSCPFFPHPTRFKDRVPEDDQMRISEKKRGNARGSRYRNAPRARARARRDLQIAKARTSLAARCLNSTLVRETLRL